MNTNELLDAETIRVSCPVDDPDVPIWREVMAALPDPADPDQAMLNNVPFLNDSLNFGDLVRLGPPDDLGVRPVLEVLTASGHVHLLAATDPGETTELAEELQRHFPSYALRVEAARGALVCVSVHPDLNPREVEAVICAWLGEEADDEEETLAVGPPCETRIGPVAHPLGRVR